MGFGTRSPTTLPPPVHRVKMSPCQAYASLSLSLAPGARDLLSLASLSRLSRSLPLSPRLSKCRQNVANWRAAFTAQSPTALPTVPRCQMMKGIGCPSKQKLLCVTERRSPPGAPTVPVSKCDGCISISSSGVCHPAANLFGTRPPSSAHRLNFFKNVTDVSKTVTDVSN